MNIAAGAAYMVIVFFPGPHIVPWAAVENNFYGFAGSKPASGQPVQTRPTWFYVVWFHGFAGLRPNHVQGWQ
jgi:hypothetical protein